MAADGGKNSSLESMNYSHFLRISLWKQEDCLSKTQDINKQP
jgi:hypothetical protein